MAPLPDGALRSTERVSARSERAPHDEKYPVNPDETFDVDVEIRPTSMVVPAGHHIAFTISGKDFERPDAQGLMKG